jgi:hypothetical protein
MYRSHARCSPRGSVAILPLVSDSAGGLIPSTDAPALSARAIAHTDITPIHRLPIFTALPLSAFRVDPGVKRFYATLSPRGSGQEKRLPVVGQPLLFWLMVK